MRRPLWPAFPVPYSVSRWCRAMTRSTGRRRSRSARGERSPGPRRPATGPWLADGQPRLQHRDQRLSNITGAHLHSGAAGERSIRTALSRSRVQLQHHAQRPLRRAALRGSFEAADVTGITFSDLVAGMRAGTVYGNVHTSAYLGGDPRPGAGRLHQLTSARCRASTSTRTGVRGLGHGSDAFALVTSANVACGFHGDRGHGPHRRPGRARRRGPGRTSRPRRSARAFGRRAIQAAADDMRRRVYQVGALQARLPHGTSCTSSRTARSTTRPRRTTRWRARSRAG